MCDALFPDKTNIDSRLNSSLLVLEIYATTPSARSAERAFLREISVSMPPVVDQ